LAVARLAFVWRGKVYVAQKVRILALFHLSYPFPVQNPSYSGQKLVAPAAFIIHPSFFLKGA